MRRAISTLTLAFAIASGAQAATFTYVANATGPGENPVNTSPGVGTATLVIDDVANTASLAVTFSGLLYPTVAAHIHCCNTPPMNAGIAVGQATFPSGVMAGSFSNNYNLLDAAIYEPAFLSANGGTAAGARAALLAGLAAGTSYYNIHTTVFPGGEIRGFFALVPEPSLALLLAAAAFGLARARRS